MSLKLDYPPGATPLDPNEIEGLIPSDISTQGQLNTAEQHNILRAESWALGRKHKNILTEAFAKKLHREMFKDTWRWAGEFRKSEKSIGVTWFKIGVELHQLFGNAAFWIQNNTYSWSEAGARFHHRLVAIHPFPNGNGRHARLMTDVLLVSHGQEPFSWGAKSGTGNIGSANDIRERYLQALRAADERRLQELITFVKS